MSTATSLLTAEDLEFLGRPLHGFLSVAGERSRHSHGPCGSRPPRRGRSS